ncbi:uncharacterized protein LOC116344485 [Contarinia nasturtii]|uniref:uncharacterized protein LOC116344485 n=1 Tax=Contarinia nasturtii TaxID=265458 RepID=UPI0012D3E43B|nr:uncharacterized protein LOC116344485 [Contarinia nasturtii]
MIKLSNLEKLIRRITVILTNTMFAKYESFMKGEDSSFDKKDFLKRDPIKLLVQLTVKRPAKDVFLRVSREEAAPRHFLLEESEDMTTTDCLGLLKRKPTFK